MKNQKGFTLIELMIVVAIVAILAAIALPAYQDYMRRSKVSEVAATAGACKTSVAEYAAAKNKLPATLADSGCSSEATQYVKTLDVTTGQIAVEIQNIYTNIDTKHLYLTPTKDSAASVKAVDGDSIVGWHCGTEAATTDYKYFPASCRQAKL